MFNIRLGKLFISFKILNGKYDGWLWFWDYRRGEQ